MPLSVILPFQASPRILNDLFSARVREVIVSEIAIGRYEFVEDSEAKPLYRREFYRRSCRLYPGNSNSANCSR